MGWFSRTMLRTLSERGYRPILGDVYPQDCARPGTDVIVRRVLERVGPGSIIILHDGNAHGVADRNQSVDAVETLVRHLQRERYELCTVSQLIEAGERESAEAESSPTALDADCA
jgi:peptidoglycan/xylan/chitin deacetylase (PgdA/CDA1 family)